MNLEDFRQRALSDLKKITDPASLEIWRIKYLGRKSELNQFLRSLADLSLEERRELSPKANGLRKEFEELYDKKAVLLKAKSYQLKAFDITMPGHKIPRGHLHPLTLVENEVKEIFRNLNFSVVEGPELETEYYNFDALNIPSNHPARDMWDTLWLQGSQRAPSTKYQVPSTRLLMRTHTSPVQIRYMEKHQPPFQIIVPGRVFRHEATDAFHEINFHQVEGLMAGKDISLANFKFVVTEFFKKFFRKPVEFRIRPSYFPFTEPSIEVDIRFGQLSNVKGQWLEVMGAGMVHPKVFEAVKYDSKKVQGFAFGAGIERLAMIKYKIPDIRLFYSSDLRFIRQF